MRYSKEFIGETLGAFMLVLFGWGSAAFPDHAGGFFFVYIPAPILGGILASLFFVNILEPAMNRSVLSCNCANDEPLQK
ncbi:MAG: hypothetical protein Q8N05_09060 [Bacteroidota bacterium]|nr:hypothetical protein [Bacteroidota bacterium]